MIMKAALVADGIGCVSCGPKMDQQQLCRTQKARQCANLYLPPPPIIFIYDPFTHLWGQHTGTNLPATKALNTMPESCFNICNNVVCPSVMRDSVLFEKEETVLGVSSVLCVLLQLTRVRSWPARNHNFHYQNIVYICKGFQSSGSWEVCSLDYVSSVDKHKQILRDGGYFPWSIDGILMT